MAASSGIQLHCWDSAEQQKSTPYPRGLQRHFGEEQDFHCVCAVGLTEYSSGIIDLEGGMAAVRRIDLKSPLAELTIEGICSYQDEALRSDHIPGWKMCITVPLPYSACEKPCLALGIDISPLH